MTETQSGTGFVDVGQNTIGNKAFSTQPKTQPETTPQKKNVVRRGFEDGGPQTIGNRGFQYMAGITAGSNATNAVGNVGLEDMAQPLPKKLHLRHGRKHGQKRYQKRCCEL